jgi:hypothetical protein
MHSSSASDLSSSSATNVDKDQTQDDTIRNLVTNALLFDYQEVADCPSPLHPQLDGSEIGLVGLGDWLEQANTMLSRDEEEELASPYHGCDSSSVPEKSQ